MDDDFDRILRIVCETAVRLAPVDHSNIVVFDPTSKSGIVRAEFPVKWRTLGKIVPVEEGFIERHLLKTINPIVVEDVEHDCTPAGKNIRVLNPAVKSTVILPIVVDEDIKGSFAFNVLKKKHEFTTEEIQSFSSLGQVAAQIFKSAALLEQTRIQTEKLEALRKAMLAITRERQREPLLRTIIEQAIRLLAAAGGGIYKYKPRRRELELVEDYKWPEQVGVMLKPGEGLSGRLFLSNEKYLATPDYQNSQFKAAAIVKDVGSALAVPLLWQNHRTGVLYVNGKRGRNFTEDEAELLERFAAMASIALEHSRLRERDRYMVQRLQSLAHATNEIISRIDDADMDGQLTQIARNAHEILNAEACGIHQVIRPGYLTLVASDGHRPGDFQKGREFKITSGLGTGLTGHIAHERKPFRKCGNELSNHFAVANNRQASGCHSLLAIPLMKKTAAGEEVTGLIRISNKKGRRGFSDPWECFTRADQSVAEVFAQAAAVVLAKTRLLDEIRNLNQTWNIILKAVDIENALEELAMILVTVLDKSFCRIFLIDESEKLLHIIAAVQREPKQFVWEPKPEGEVAFVREWRNLERSLNSGRSSVLPRDEDGTERKDDLYNLKRLSKKLKIRSLKNKPLGVESLLSIPLKVGNRKVGLITIGEIKGPDAKGFGSSQIKLARTIASQATLLIDKQSHQDELSRRQKLDERQSNALTQIRAIQSARELFGVIVKQAASVFKLAIDDTIIAGMIIETAGRGTLKLIDSVHGERQLKKTKLIDLAGTFSTVSREAKSKCVYDFKASKGEEDFVAKYNLNVLLATHITVSSDMRCILFVGDKMPWPRLSHADLEILERLGQHSGISLTKTLVQEQATKERAGNYLVAAAMALDQSEVMVGKAVQGILKSMDCDTVTLYVLDSKKGQLRFPPELAGVKDKAAALKVLEDERESVIKRVNAIDDYHANEDTLHDDLLKGEFVRSEKIVSSAAIPIIAQEEEKIGVMFVNYRSRHRFDENDRENMKYLAHQAAVAITNVRMYKKGKSQEIFLEALYQTERAISSANDLQQALEIVALHVWKVASANNRTANVVSINRIENNRARVVAAYPPEEFAHIQQVLKGEIDLIDGEQIGLVGVAFKEGVSKIFTGLKRTPNPHPQHVRLHNDTQSELVALIRDQDSLIVGAITVENSDEDAFDKDDLNVMETLAGQAGVAIQKDKQTAVLEKLNRDIARKRVIGLAAASTSVLRHKINMSAIQISFAADQYLSHNPGEIREPWATGKLQEIARYADEIKNMPLGVPLFDQSGRPNKSVNAMIRGHIDRLKGSRDNDGIEIEAVLSAPDETTVKIYEEWFVVTLAFFTQNSLRVLKDSETKQLVIKSMISKEGWCRIEICDTGPGMDDETWSRLFEPKVAVTPHSQGMRVGLLNADFIIDEHGGIVHRVSNIPRRVIIGFSLPTVS